MGAHAELPRSVFVNVSYPVLASFFVSRATFSRAPTEGITHMKLRQLSTLLAGAGLAAAALAPSALADTPSSVSSNWSGYRAATQDGSGFSKVTGSWTEPSAD